MFIIVVQGAAPSNGDYNGADTGSFVIDNVNCIIYEQTGAPDSTVWSAEGA